MGEAKRRKKLDPNFGKKRYNIDFLAKNQLTMELQQQWSEIEIAKKEVPFSCVKFTLYQETLFGLAFVSKENNTFGLKYEWIFDDEKIIKQQRIVNQYLKTIDQELLRVIIGQEQGIDLTLEQISKISSKTHKSDLPSKPTFITKIF